jgi:hypothetical protein
MAPEGWMGYMGMKCIFNIGKIFVNVYGQR